MEPEKVDRLDYTSISLPIDEQPREHLLLTQQIDNGLMEVRAFSSCARLEWEYLKKVPQARQRLRQIFDKFDTLCSLPNFFTPLRLTGLTAAMVSRERSVVSNSGSFGWKKPAAARVAGVCLFLYVIRRPVCDVINRYFRLRRTISVATPVPC